MNIYAGVNRTSDTSNKYFGYKFIYEEYEDMKYMYVFSDMMSTYHIWFKQWKYL